MSGSGLVTSERMQSLLEAVVAMSSDLSLDGVLQRIVRSAAELVDAEYGFLGVLDGHPGRRLGTFATHGLDEAHQAMIGRLPEGLGVLGHVIDHPEPLRVDNLQQHPARTGFPRLHPDMTSFLGVPIRIKDRVFGNLYLTEKRGGNGFTTEDEAIAVALASAAGVVIENARLYQDGERQRMWLEATADIATALQRPLSRAAAKRLVTERARDVSGADVTGLLMPEPDGSLVVRALSGLPEELVGQPADRMSLLHDVVAHGKTLVVADAAADSRYASTPESPWPEMSSLHAMPLPLSDAEGTGVLVMAWLRDTVAPPWALDPALPQSFAQQAALVMRVVRAQEDQARVAVFEDRERIGRDLHDVVIQRLFAVGLMLESTTRQVTSEAVRERLDGALNDLDQTIVDIRRTIFDLTSPPGPVDLRAEMRAVLDDVAPLLGFTPELETRGPLESAVSAPVAEQVLAVLTESASNVVRHAGASRLHVLLDCTGDVELLVTDDGSGLGADHRPGNGLRNIRHRAESLGGSCRFRGRPGRGLEVHWRIPRAPS